MRFDYTEGYEKREKNAKELRERKEGKGGERGYEPRRLLRRGANVDYGGSTTADLDVEARAAS